MMTKTTQKRPLTAQTVLQKIDRKVAHLLRHWDQYIPGMFTQKNYSCINNAFDELCVLYKESSLTNIPCGDSMLDQFSYWLEEACKQLSQKEKQILYAEYKEFYCPDLERASCDAAECVGCCEFNDYLVEEFEGYLSFYQNVKIEKAMYGEYY